MNDTLEDRYFKYDPDTDHNGAYGHEIAEAIFKRCGNDLDIFFKWIMTHRLTRIEREAHENQSNQEKLN